MIYKSFCGENVSMLGLGNMRLPKLEGKGESIDREKAEAILRHAYNSGINYFDTAYRYHGGESELFVGEVLSTLPRDSYFLASKMPGHMMELKDGKLGFKGYLAGKEAATIPQIFEEQLIKCRVDYFDFYLLHNLCESSYDFYMDKELGVVDYMLKEKAAGRIKHLGVSAHGRAETIDKFLSEYPGVFEFVQLQLNYLDWKLQDAKAKYEAVRKHGLPMVVMEPVRGGRLIDLPENAKELLLKEQPEASAASWAFRYLQGLDGVDLVLSGMSNLEQLNENLEIFSRPNPISQREEAVLMQAAETMLNLVPCTGCRYCTEECPKGIDIPKLIALYNETNNGGAMLQFNMDANKQGENPAACIGCGACTSICPQSIAVPEVLGKFAAHLEKK